MKRLFSILLLAVFTVRCVPGAAAPPAIAHHTSPWPSEAPTKPGTPSKPQVKGGMPMKASLPGTVPLSDLTQSGATTGQVAQWNGSAWAPGTGGSGITAITGDVQASGSGSVSAQVVSVATQAGPFQVNNPAVTNFSTGNNGSVTYELTTTTSSATPNTSMTFGLPGSGGVAGNVSIVISGLVSGTTTGVSQVWSGFVVDHAGTCATMSAGGTLTALSTGSNGTVASTPVSVALSGCSINVTVTGTASTNWVWSATLQLLVAGP